MDKKLKNILDLNSKRKLTVGELSNISSDDKTDEFISYIVSILISKFKLMCIYDNIILSEDDIDLDYIFTTVYTTNRDVYILTPIFINDIKNGNFDSIDVFCNNIIAGLIKLYNL